MGYAGKSWNSNFTNHAVRRYRELANQLEFGFRTKKVPLGRIYKWTINESGPQNLAVGVKKNLKASPDQLPPSAHLYRKQARPVAAQYPLERRPMKARALSNPSTQHDHM